MLLGMDIGSNRLAVYALDPVECAEKWVFGPKFDYAFTLDAYDAVGRFLREYPEHDDGDRLAFIEAPYVAINPNSTIKQVYTNGAVQVALFEWGFSVYLVPPARWKKELGVGGNASKQQVKDFLEREEPTRATRCAGDEDLLDALGVGLYGRAVSSRADRLASGRGVSG